MKTNGEVINVNKSWISIICHECRKFYKLLYGYTTDKGKKVYVCKYCNEKIDSKNEREKYYGKGE